MIAPDHTSGGIAPDHTSGGIAPDHTSGGRQKRHVRVAAYLFWKRVICKVTLAFVRLTH